MSIHAVLRTHTHTQWRNHIRITRQLCVSVRVRHFTFYQQQRGNVPFNLGRYRWINCVQHLLIWLNLSPQKLEELYASSALSRAPQLIISFARQIIEFAFDVWSFPTCLLVTCCCRIKMFLFGNNLIDDDFNQNDFYSAVLIQIRTKLIFIDIDSRAVYFFSSCWLNLRDHLKRRGQNV